MGVKHKHHSGAEDNGQNVIQPSHWNEDHEIDGVLGDFVNTASEPGSLLYVNEVGEGATIPLSPAMRTVLALLSNEEIRTALGALAAAGDTMTGALAMSGYKITGLGAPSAAGDAVNKAYADSLTMSSVGALAFKGDWDAAGGAFPSPGGLKAGSFFIASSAGVVNGINFDQGDQLFALVDGASSSVYAGNWRKIEGGISLAEVQAAVGFTFGSLAASSSVTASQINDASANGRSLIKASDYAAMRVLLGLATVATSGQYSDLSGKPTLGTAAALNVGTGNNNVVQLDGTAKLPAVDGSQLTNMPGATAATQTEMEAAASTSKMVTPANFKQSPYAVKAWCKWGVTSTILASQGVTSLADNGTGSWTVNLSAAMSSVNYAAVYVVEPTSTGPGSFARGTIANGGLATGSVGCQSVDGENSLIDPTSNHLVIVGDQ